MEPSRAWAAALAAFLLVACDGAVTPVDAAVGDGGVGEGGADPVDDAGTDPADDGGTDPADAGADAGQSADAGACDCGADEACVRGVCLARCGGDPSAFEATLGEGLSPIANFCRRAGARAVRVEGASVEVWDVIAATEGTSTIFTLSRWQLDPAVSSPPIVEVATATHDTGDGEVMLFPGGYLELDPSGARAAFGYTTSAEGFAGGVFVVEVASGDVTELPAPSNFDVAFMDATHLLVDAFGLDEEAAGPGLYAAELSAAPSAHHAVTGIGDYSGSVAAGPTYVLAGGVEDGTFASHVYVVPTAQLEAAITGGSPIDASADSEVVELLDPDGAPLPSTFSLLGDRLVTTPFGGPLTSYAITSTGELALSDARVLATGDAFTDALDAGDGRLLLVHANGLLLVAE